jgi:Fe-S cluster assembly protein SufD
MVIDHAVPDCESHELFKNVLADKARGVFQGKIIVARDAQRTNGYQMSRGLLLSPGAEADTKPELEIYADDVKCSHGATVGALDDTSIFYLRSRGIPEGEAKALLVGAFVAEVLDQIDDETVRGALTTHVDKWLEANRSRIEGAASADAFGGEGDDDAA